MTDYNSLKVPDLKALLGQRKLPQTGNKQALIGRLQEDDEKNGSATDETKPPASKEDEINYSDDDGNASKSAAQAPAPAPAPTAATAAPDAKAEEPTKTVEATAEDGSAQQNDTAQSFAIGLASTAADEEAKKRSDRARRFGIEEDDDAKRRAERAKRFGIDQKEIASGLDSALPERSLKRGRGRDADGNRPGKRQGRPRGRGNRHGENAGGGSGILEDAGERAKAEKRAARFATA